MNITPSKCIAVLTWILIIALGSLSLTPRNINEAIADKGFAVVELFTSEGCSSCPPADELVARIQKESNGFPVYILAYHVDYWNRLGWKDAFSSAAYSQRQSQYAGWLNASLYTPQAVVNGHKEFVGSEESMLRNAIKNELQKTSPGRIALQDVKKEGRKITLQYHLEGKPSNASLVLALVEKNAVSKVLKGENRGRTLSHVQIVRNVQTILMNGQSDGAGILEVPEELDKQNLEVIVFLQNNSNGEIVAATRSDINVSSLTDKAGIPANR